MKTIRLLFLLLLFPAILFNSCKKSESQLGKALFRESRNPVFKEIEPAELAPVLEQMLEEKDMKYGKLIAGFYREHNYTPQLLERYLPGGEMELLLEYYNKAHEHGLDPAMFQPEDLKRLLDTLGDKNSIQTSGEASRFLARLELLTASSLAAYAGALQYGVTNPSEIYERYYIETARPD
ncbi:MAG TPA: L,D-transpeptidase, partial [Anseongella sp.]|nr:L,D-transpeptidase [Anseongella sp.]